MFQGKIFCGKRIEMESRNILKVFFAGIVSGITCMFITIFVLSVTGKIDLGALIVKGSSAETALERQIDEKSDLIKAYIDRYYLDNIDGETMSNSIYKGIVNGLGDDYAAYYTKDEYKTITEKSSGTYCGIGAYVSVDTSTGAIYIVKPLEDSPAQEAGIKAGDIIYAVDGENVTGQDLTSVLSKVKGEAGTTVNLKIVREGESDYLDIKVERRVIEEDTVVSKMLSDKIGYIKVTAFEDVTSKQFEDAVDLLEKKGMKSLIIDLRDNGGGLLSAAVEMLDRLLPKGLVVYTKDKNGVAEEYYAEDNKMLEVPMAILVNENSASASEVFSGALQDEEAAKLVGTKTFGKGIVQTIFGLEDGTALKMTTSKYYTPKGRNIHNTGLEPDIKVELDENTLTESEDKFGIDNQMQAAIDYLK